MAQPRQERRYERSKEGNVISAIGELPLKTAAHDRAAIEDPGRFFAEALKARLAARGVEVKGPALTIFSLSPGEIPKEENVSALDKHASPPLGELLAVMLRHDLALNAEAVFKTLGRKATGRPGSFANGAAAVEQWLDGLHLPGPAAAIADGSGRSAANRLTAAQLAGVLRRMLREDSNKLFETLLPRAGEDVLAGRLAPAAQPEGDGKNPPAKGERRAAAKGQAPLIWAKPASGEGVEGLAGWARTLGGRRLVFVMLINGSRTPPAVLRAQFDALALEIARSRIGE